MPCGSGGISIGSPWWPRIHFNAAPRASLHSLKPWETYAYDRMNLTVPVTIATSDPASLLDASRAGSHQWIHKGMVGGCDYTEEYVPPRSLDEAREQLAYFEQLRDAVVEAKSAGGTLEEAKEELSLGKRFIQYRGYNPFSFTGVEADHAGAVERMWNAVEE